MTEFCVRLLERFLSPDLSTYVVGDVLEQRHRGRLWMLRQTLAAVVLLRARPHRGDGMLLTFANDVRIAARYLRHAPVFAVTSVITLGLSIGATTAIFSAIEPVLLRPPALSGIGPIGVRLGAWTGWFARQSRIRNHSRSGGAIADH